MTTQAADFLGAIEHLPAGATLTLQNVGWDDYEQLLTELTERPGLRVSYADGRMEIMSPLLEHEEYKGLIHDLVRILSEELGIKLEARGSATFKLKEKAKGVEPDECFYVKNASRIIGKRQIDLNVDPPPDVVVEIDITNESLRKFPIYAALTVPEIWRYDGRQMHFYELVGNSYHEIAVSSAFPMLASFVLGESIEQSKTLGQSAVLLQFRKWVRSTFTKSE